MDQYFKSVPAICFALASVLTCTSHSKLFLGGKKVVVLLDHAEVERIVVHGKNTERANLTIQMFVVVWGYVSIHQIFGLIVGTCRFQAVIPKGQVALPTSK